MNATCLLTVFDRVEWAHRSQDSRAGATIKNDSGGSFLEGRRTGNSCPVLLLITNDLRGLK